MRWFISMILLLLQGCADMGYYWHSASGHLEIMNDRVDIDELLLDDSLDAELRVRLQLVQEIRRFSVEKLALPENDSYQSYVQLDRPYVVQNLFAAPEFSTRLYQWCYPVIGCTSYRGYYEEQRLKDYVTKLKDEGYEIYIGQVPAYSTLGWFDDPVLSSFIHWPEYRLAGLLFHELTHQRLFIDDDTTFNESLATAVQQAGTRLWLKENDLKDQLDLFDRWLRYRREVIDLITDTRSELNGLYALDITDSDKRLRKQDIFDAARQQHTALAQSHGISGGYTRWFEVDLNNAKVGSVGAYNDWLTAFLNILQSRDGDFEAFFNYVERLGEQNREARDRCLQAWETSVPPGSNVCQV